VSIGGLFFVFLTPVDGETTVNIGCSYSTGFSRDGWGRWRATMSGMSSSHNINDSEG